MSIIICKYGCVSDTDYFPEFDFDEQNLEYTCEICIESETEESKMNIVNKKFINKSTI